MSKPRDPVLALLGIGRSEFLTRVWGRQVLHARNAKAPPDFVGLGWTWLEEVVSRGEVTYPRLRMAADGQLVSPARFVRYREVFAGDPLSVESHIVPARVRECLASGATLVLDRLEGLHAPTRRFGLELQRQLLAPVQSNLYATKGRRPAFDLHADAGDSFVLQLAGEKRWTVYRPGPEPGDEVAPLLDRVLRTGDVLYAPAGYWHRAAPQEPGSLHLTITATPLTLQVLLRWAQDQYPDVRAALDRRLSVEASSVPELRGAISSVGRALSAGVVDDYATMMRSLDRVAFLV